MTKRKQIALLRSIARNMVEHLIKHGAARWPDTWDGHEFRELIARQADYERTRLMRENRRRRLDCWNEINTRALF